MGVGDETTELEMTYDKVCAAHDAYFVAREQYLRDRGWVLANDNPAGYWLWQREIDGKKYTLLAEQACETQGLLDLTQEFRDSK